MKKHTMQMLDLSYMNAVPVLLRKADELHVYLVGCGGTGSWLAPDIARLAVEFRHQWKHVHVTFIDHDSVERANIPRQNFCHAELNANKAEALAARYGPAWGIEIAAIPQRLEPTMIADSWRGDSIIIGCVDNAAAHKTIAETLKRHSTAQPSTWWLDSGNHAQSGQVLLGSTADPKTGGPRIWQKQDGTRGASFELTARASSSWAAATAAAATTKPLARTWKPPTVGATTKKKSQCEDSGQWARADKPRPFSPRKRKARYERQTPSHWQQSRVTIKDSCGAG
jgi:PRTRC genetic system ThiF family protein